VGVELGFGASLKPVRVGFIVGRAEVNHKIVLLEHNLGMIACCDSCQL
jgi:hypothetical protein